MQTINKSQMKSQMEPEVFAENRGPFGSWPDKGLPDGYFELPMKDEATAFYRENGWLVMHEALGADQMDALLNETTSLCRNKDEAIKGVDPAPAGMSDEQAVSRVLCVHNPHKSSPVFKAALAWPELTQVLTRIIGPNVKCMQSMQFLKASGKPGQAWHQDEDFIPTRDRSLTGAWIAMDDATMENGCLWVLSKSHLPGVLWPQKFHFDKRFDCARESYNFPWQNQDSLPVEVKRGSIVFFNGYTLHRSLPNRAKSGFRRALVHHYMSAESLLPWRRPKENESVALSDFRDIELVAGTDPYAYKGTEDLVQPVVRSDGKGGCADWSDENQKKIASKHKK
jgi:ectoine hydroxylase-related dioxygenase (phytanoyl-CoA dioxygenase family)